MSNGAKIHLSKFETDLVTDAEWILTKQAVINKVCTFFGEVHDVYKMIASSDDKVLKELEILKNGKLTKGENYLGLPYIILDYPASFNKNAVLAIRTMFWWGNFLSITLHMSGKEVLSKFDLTLLQSHFFDKDCFICINKDQWNHTYSDDNYIPLMKIKDDDFKSILTKSFVKVSKKIDISHLHEAPLFFETSFVELMDFLNISYRGDETTL